MDKVALIIGGTGGIGSSVVRLLSEKGIKTYATYYHSSGKVERASRSENIKFIQCDITQDKDIKRVVDQILCADAKIDIVINTATGGLKLKLFEQLTYEDFLEDIQIILLGAINLFKRVVPLMKQNRSGMIINLLTATIDDPPVRMSSYIAAKSGLLGLIRSLGPELRPFNVKIYGISPSFVETELITGFPKKLLEIEREKQPGKMFIQPDDIAELILDIIERPEKYQFGININLKTRQEIRYLMQSPK